MTDPDPSHDAHSPVPLKCADLSAHTALDKSLNQVLECMKSPTVEHLVSSTITNELFLRPWVAYRDDYLLHPRFEASPLFSSTPQEPVAKHYQYIVTEVYQRSQCAESLPKHAGARAYTIRLFASLIDGLGGAENGLGAGRLRSDKMWLDDFESLWALVEYLKSEYEHGHGALMDVIEGKEPSRWLRSTSQESKQEEDGDDAEVANKQRAESGQDCKKTLLSDDGAEPTVYYSGFTEDEESDEEESFRNESQGDQAMDKHDIEVHVPIKAADRRRHHVQSPLGSDVYYRGLTPDESSSEDDEDYRGLTDDSTSNEQGSSNFKHGRKETPATAKRDLSRSAQALTHNDEYFSGFTDEDSSSEEEGAEEEMAATKSKVEEGRERKRVKMTVPVSVSSDSSTSKDDNLFVDEIEVSTHAVHQDDHKRDKEPQRSAQPSKSSRSQVEILPFEQSSSENESVIRPQICRSSQSRPRAARTFPFEQSSSGDEASAPTKLLQSSRSKSKATKTLPFQQSSSEVEDIGPPARGHTPIANAPHDVSSRPESVGRKFAGSSSLVTQDVRIAEIVGTSIKPSTKTPGEQTRSELSLKDPAVDHTPPRVKPTVSSRKEQHVECVTSRLSNSTSGLELPSTLRTGLPPARLQNMILNAWDLDLTKDGSTLEDQVRQHIEANARRGQATVPTGEAFNPIDVDAMDLVNQPRAGEVPDNAPTSSALPNPLRMTSDPKRIPTSASATTTPSQTQTSTKAPPNQTIGSALLSRFRGAQHGREEPSDPPPRLFREAHWGGAPTQRGSLEELSAQQAGVILARRGGFARARGVGGLQADGRYDEEPGSVESPHCGAVTETESAAQAPMDADEEG